MFGIRDFFVVAAQYIDFAIDFYGFDGIAQFSQASETSHVALMYFTIGAALTAGISRSNKNLVESERIKKVNRQLALDYLKMKPFLNIDTVSKLINSALIVISLHIFLNIFAIALAPSIKPHMFINTINAFLLFHAAELPLTAFIARFEALGAALASRNEIRSYERLTRALTVALVFGGIGVMALLEVYKVWAFITLHGIMLDHAFVALVCFYSLILPVGHFTLRAVDSDLTRAGRMKDVFTATFANWRQNRDWRLDIRANSQSRAKDILPRGSRKQTKKTSKGMNEIP